MLSRLFNNYSPLESEQAPRISAIAVAVAALTVLTIILIQSYQAYSYRPQTSKTAPRPAPQSDYKAHTITSKHLFGRLAAGNAQQLDQLNLPQTGLQLVLRGAFTSSNQALASAIIEIPGQSTHAYKIGSNVYGNTRLHAVYRDRVVLSRSGQLETLYFPEPQSGNTGAVIGSLSQNEQAAIPAEVVDLVRENATLDDVKEITTQLSSPTLTAEQRRQLIRQRLQELRNRAKN